MATTILGLLGKKQSGKDTFAGRLVAQHNYTRLAFADALKALAADLDPWICVSPDEAGIAFGSGSVRVRPVHVKLSSILSDLGWEEAKRLREVRAFLQDLGVSARNNIDENVWVRAVALQADAIDGPVVITDVRFPNEVATVLAAGGKTLRVVRPDLVSTDTHVSETLLDAVNTDLTVINDAGIGDLYDAADYAAFLLSASR